MSDWDAWIGREERRRDVLTPGLAARWLATFDRDAPANGAMPQGIHWCLCPPDAPTAALGEDGHPARDDTRAGFLPPIPLPRRMWAGSEVEFIRPLRINDTVERVSRIMTIAEKRGQSGPLAFVTVEHTTHADGAAALREMQTLVYREAAAPDAALSPPPIGAERSPQDAPSRRFTPTPPLLFRYSALTFNSHRIHYDAPYAREVERYRGLVVHGPLIASSLLDLASHELGDNALSHFAFRAQSPAIAGEPLTLNLAPAGPTRELVAMNGGRMVMNATATLR